MYCRIAYLFIAATLAAPCKADEPSPKTIKDSVGIELVRIVPGRFVMGSPPDEARRQPYETDETLHPVNITRAFWIAAHETTRGQFRGFVEATDYRTECERDGLGGYGVDSATGALSDRDPKYSWRYVGFEQTDDHPVVNVTWNDAVAFCAWLSAREGATYRLPTDAEWEYACRAGTRTTNYASDDPEDLAMIANSADGLCRRAYPDRETIAGEDGYLYTAPVGSYRANAWGLHDMLGNVWEWTADWHGPVGTDEQTDPTGPATGTDRNIKGGDWFHGPAFCRSAMRFPIPPNLPRRHGGFRVVRSVEVAP